MIVEALKGRVLEAMSREPANEDTCLAQSGLDQTQIIGKLIGGSEEGKCGSSEAQFGSSEVTKSKICRSLILRLTISRNI